MSPSSTDVFCRKWKKKIGKQSWADLVIWWRWWGLVNRPIFVLPVGLLVPPCMAKLTFAKDLLSPTGCRNSIASIADLLSALFWLDGGFWWFFSFTPPLFFFFFFLCGLFPFWKISLPFPETQWEVKGNISKVRGNPLSGGCHQIAFPLHSCFGDRGVHFWLSHHLQDKCRGQQKYRTP